MIIKMQKVYILYGTSGCHLCDEAETMIITAIKSDAVIYIKKDIVEDNNLLQKYALTIPVFKCVTTQQELNWPFTDETIRRFIDVSS